MSGIQLNDLINNLNLYQKIIKIIVIIKLQLFITITIYFCIFLFNAIT